MGNLIFICCDNETIYKEEIKYNASYTFCLFLDKNKHLYKNIIAIPQNSFFKKYIEKTKFLTINWSYKNANEIKYLRKNIEDIPNKLIDQIFH